ncbi:hypothetical protein E3N88_24841 [Mikania micrantha]|uniref:Reverse transcriptase zinc-binding domain-containing protein n=1 Tax=Mikania micrantha TaxID=192012 RepID=A0A5N6N4B5_9ASTR|nr:hypothetical protein E3N88_24841 [Mikania micrantha]
MAASQEYLDKMQLRQNYRNVWHTDLMRTISADTPFFYKIFTCSGPCVSYLLRKRALYDDMSRYTCCAGYMPCSGRCGESKCPELCLCTEVFCCFGNSVASTRFLLQDEFNIQTTQCDNCIIGFMFCLQQLACICSIVACLVGNDELSDASQALNCLADIVYCTVCACMQTQHKVEMDKRDGKFGPVPMAVPPAQQMSRFDQPNPPNIERDKWVWGATNPIEFSVGSVRALIEERLLPYDNFKIPWIKWVPLKVNVFAWRAGLDCIPSKDCLIKRGISINYMCSLCSVHSESSVHLLLRCGIASSVWDKVFMWCKAPKELILTIRDILILHNSWPFSTMHKKLLHAIFVTTLWCIWKARNAKVFENKALDPMEILGI